MMGLFNAIEKLCLIILFITCALVNCQDDMRFRFQESSPNWVILKSSTGIKFTPRNAHASCIYQGRIWVTGGKTDLYRMYNTLYSFKAGDVWWSLDGADWQQEATLLGDFYAQNADTIDSYSLAPWYQRFGHTLNPIDINGDGVEDAMIQLGGFAPGPMNDVWITPDGQTWIYCGNAPWSPRAWHSTVNYKGNLYIMGGSPLNNDVWVMGAITQYNRRAPMTRAMYSPYTYTVDWTYLGQANWSPRAGMQVISQWYYDPTMNQTLATSDTRMVFTGGFGGYLQEDSKYDGFRSRADVWESYNGSYWTLIADNAFTPRAWHTVSVLHDTSDMRLDLATNAGQIGKPPRMWMVGGGYIGDSTFDTKITTKMLGRTDMMYAWKGDDWTAVNYEQGNGVRKYDTFVQYYSSQEWTVTIVDSKTQYLGMWGSTSAYLNGSFILLAGDKTGAGPLQSETYLALDGIFCDQLGVICSGHGECGSNHAGCECSIGYTGLYCEVDLSAPASPI